MKMKRDSTKKNWDDFWDRKQEIDDVYSNFDRIINNLTKVTDFENKLILEVGAGSARDSFKFIEQGAEVFVLDYSPSAFKIISTLDSSNKIHPILADAFAIPVPDESFDIVFHQGLLEHFRNPTGILQENIRVLKKGGFLLVDVPQKYHFYTLIKHILIFFNKWFAGWETEFTIKQLQDIIEKHNIKIIYNYGSWMRPSLFYRIIREILLKINLKLPLYPKGLTSIRKIRDKIRNKLIRSKFAFYTFLDIGIIAKK